jgi:hypothetical protein
MCAGTNNFGRVAMVSVLSDVQERKRKAESKESAALAAMNTPRANSNYEMMVHSADEQPSGIRKIGSNNILAMLF